MRLIEGDIPNKLTFLPGGAVGNIDLEVPGE
jgi:hypothetical protein